MEEKFPLIKILERPGKPIAIRVFYYDRIPNILNHFPDAVLRRAVNKGRTREEDRILKAARSLSRIGYRIVEQHVIYQRALKVQEQMRREALRAIKVRRFPRQQNSRLSRDHEAIAASFTASQVQDEALSLTQLYARRVGADPAELPRSSPPRDRGRGR